VDDEEAENKALESLRNEYIPLFFPLGCSVEDKTHCHSFLPVTHAVRPPGDRFSELP